MRWPFYAANKALNIYYTLTCVFVDFAKCNGLT